MASNSQQENRPIPPLLAQQLGRIGTEFPIEGDIFKSTLKRIRERKTQAISAEELPDDTALEQMRTSVEHNPLISYYIPNNKELRQIHTQGLPFEKSPDLKDVVFSTLFHDISKRFNVSLPLKKEQKLPTGWWEVLSDIRGTIQYELNNYGYYYHYD